MKKPDSNTRSVILLDETNLLGLALPLAGFLQKEPNTVVIPISPATASAWLDREIEIEDIIIDYWQKRGLSIWRSDKPPIAKLHILGLYPWSEQHQEPLWFFAEKYGKDIVSWIDNHEWPDSHFINALRKICPLIKVLPNQSLLKVINPPYCPRNWEHSEYALTQNFKHIAKENIAFRIAAALYIGSCLEKNTGEAVVIPYFCLAIDELLQGEYNPTVSWLAEKFEDSLHFPEKARKKIRILRKSATAGRPIAYANLGKVADYIDLTSLLFNITKEYPWLCAIKANGRFYAGSRIIDLENIFKSYPKADGDTMLKILQGEVKHFRQPPGSPDG